MDEQKCGIKSFCTTLGLTLAATAWSVEFTGGLLQTAVVALVVAALWYLPWQRWPMVRLGLQLAAGGLCLYAGLAAARRSIPELPLWQWLIGWALLLVVLCYLGQKPLYEAGIPLGIFAAGLLLLIFLVAMPLWDGASVVSYGVPWQGVGAGVMLLGCGLTGRELSPKQKAARLGGLVGVVLWALTALTPGLVWSGAALQSLPRALPSAWQRIQLLSLIYCPDVLLCALAALLCLWQNAALAGILKSILYKRRSL